MKWRKIFHIVGIISFFLSVIMVLPLICGLIYFDNSIIPMVKSIGITFFSSLILYFVCKSDEKKILTQREGIAIVGIGWTVVGLFGSLPFYFEGSFPTFVDAFFESVSGFTTTGSSVLTNIEGVSKGILFWRSLIQWLGGMGIIVLSIAILPFLGVGGMQLFKAEVPSPVPDKLAPRISDTAKILWKVYGLITVIQIIFLMFGGMNFFDSLNHALTTMPTGGFSTQNGSIAQYNSVYFDFVFIFFMILAGINFSLHFQFLKGESLAFWRDSECRFFLGLCLVFSLIITINTYWYDTYETIGEAFRYSSFQVVSIVTTTGYATADYEKWPEMSQLIIFFCMFFGASAGSTGGGMKLVRVMLTFKYCYRELFVLIHPRSVSQIKLGGKVVPDGVMKSILGFMALYIGLFVICTIILSSFGVDFKTSLGAVASCIGNIGPGFGLVGPVQNYALIPEPGKWLLIWCMLLGRLEIYTIIIFLVPEFWKK